MSHKVETLIDLLLDTVEEVDYDQSDTPENYEDGDLDEGVHCGLLDPGP